MLHTKRNMRAEVPGTDTDRVPDSGTHPMPRHGRFYPKATLGNAARHTITVALIGSMALLCATGLRAQSTTGSMSLKSVPVPGPTPDQLAEYVRDKQAAIQLGKALFWDTRVGSDNKTACASCHFSAGADNRLKNQVDPGLLRRYAGFDAPNPDHTFQLGGGPNYVLKPGDFPFTKHSDINNADTKISDINDIASSQGVFTSDFKDISKTTALGPDVCTVVPDAVFNHGDGFNINGINTRRVEPRNTPTVINAAFNFRNFWDGRGNNIFNGSDPFGKRNPASLAWKIQSGLLFPVNVALPSSSLASQGVGPPLSGTEMSCRSRTFAKLGQKLLGSPILADQSIAGSDSVLGSFAATKPDYRSLVSQAFNPAYWQSSLPVSFTNARAKLIATMDLHDSHPFAATPDVSVSQMEANFGLFVGLALQLYEATLIADDTLFDRNADGTASLSPQQVNGFAIFQGKGHCINCHGGPELTNASFRNVINQRVEKMVIGNGTTKSYDNGFYNIGVRPTNEDYGVGGTDAFANPLSETLMFSQGKEALLGNDFDPAKYVRPGANEVNVLGAFKAPGLRNVELTGPYFHNGGKATLMQVVDFYNRGGDFGDNNRPNLDPDIQPLNLSDGEKNDLVAFLLSLTDERVRYEKAPFDHPSLCLTNGHPGTTTSVTNRGNGEATDINPLTCLNAVGAGGAGTPLKPFLGLSPTQH